MPDENQNPSQEPALAEQPAAQVAESAPAPAPEETLVAEAAPVIEQTPTEAEPEAATEVEPQPAEHTHESILATMLTQLEGAAHMAKSEIESIIANARILFESL